MRIGQKWANQVAKARNSKYEARNKSQIRNSKYKLVWDFGISILFRISNLDIRISILLLRNKIVDTLVVHALNDVR